MARKAKFWRREPVTVTAVTTLMSGQMKWAAQFRGFGAFVFAFAANFGVVAVCEALLSHAFPPPEGVNLHDPVHLAAFVKSLPLLAQFGLLTGWASGAFIASGSAYLISGKEVLFAWAGAAINFFGVAWSIAMLPHPAWVAVTGLVLPFLVALAVPSLFGARSTAAR